MSILIIGCRSVGGQLGDCMGPLPPKYFLFFEVEFWLPVCLLLAACGLGSGGWCRYGCGQYGLFSLTWVILQIVSLLIIIVYIRSTYMCLI